MFDTATPTLTTFDYTAPPVHTRRYDRAEYTYWVLDPAIPADAHGCVPHVKLVIDHDKSRRQLTARVEIVAAAFSENIHREVLSLRERPERRILISEPSARYSAKRFDEVARLAMAALTAPVAPPADV